MPKIPTYERRGQLPTSYQSGLDSRERAAFTLGSQGLAETGKDIQEAAALTYKWHDQQLKEKSSIHLLNATTEVSEQFARGFEQLTIEEERNIGKYQGKDLTQKDDTDLITRTGDLATKILDSAYRGFDRKESEHWRQNKYFVQEFEKFRLRFAEAATLKAIEQQSKFQVQATELGMSDALEKSSVLVSTDPTKLDETVMLWRTVLGDMDKDKIPPSMQKLTPVGQMPAGADRYLPIARPSVIQKAKENVNKIAEVAFRRMIADDPKAAHKALKALGETPEGRWKLEKLYGFTGDQYAVLLSLSKTQDQFVNDVAVYNLNRGLSDSIASALSTGQTLPGHGSEEQIRKAYESVLDPTDPRSKERAVVEANKAWREIQVNKQVYKTTASFSSMSVDAIKAKVSALKPSGLNAADEAVVQDRVMQVANSVIAMRKQDPVAYARQAPQVQKQLKDGNRSGANDSVIAQQLRDGVPPGDLRILTEREVEDEKSFLLNSKGEVLGQRLRSFIERHGGKNGERQGDLNIAWKQLTTGPNALPPEYIWAANAMGTQAEPHIIAALGTDYDATKQQLGNLSSSGVSFSLIQNTAHQVGKQYLQAITGNVPERLSVYSSMESLAVRIAATKLAVNKSNDVQKEIRAAFKLVSQGYDIRGGTYYVKTSLLGGYGKTPLNPEIIHSNSERIRTNKDLLTKFQTIQPPGSMNPGNKDPAYRQKQYLEILEKRSYWINNNNNTGLQLVLDVSGVVEPVITNYTDKNGNAIPYELTWEQLGNANLLPAKSKSSWSWDFWR